MRNKSCFFMNIPSSLFGQTLGILYAPSWHTGRIVASSVRLKSTGATRWLVPHTRLQLVLEGPHHYPGASWAIPTRRHWIGNDFESAVI
jgi:hypothetical protein